MPKVFFGLFSLAFRMVDSYFGGAWAIGGLLLLIGVPVVGCWILDALSIASKMELTLKQFPIIHDGRLVALALAKVEPADWVVANWPCSSPDLPLPAVPRGAVRWVLTGNVDDVPVMLVCILHELRFRRRTTYLHLFVARPRADRCSRDSKAYQDLLAVDCEARTSASGVYVSHHAQGAALSVLGVSFMCRSAVDLARE